MDQSGLGSLDAYGELGMNSTGRMLDYGSLMAEGFPKTISIASFNAGAIMFGALSFASAGNSEAAQLIGFIGNVGNTGFNVSSVIASVLIKGGAITLGGVISFASIGLGAFSIIMFLLHKIPLGETYVGTGHFGADLVSEEDDPPGYRRILQWYEDEWARSQSTICIGSKRYVSMI